MRQEKPSATACLIAASLGFCSNDPLLAGLINPLASKASRDFMEAYGAPASWFTGFLNKSGSLRLARALERWTIPGILLHYILRKRYLHDAANRLLSQGIRQVVILGAGFDVLAASLHTKFPHATFLEVDFPATQAVKRKALASQNLRENLIFVPADFTRQTLESCLLDQPRYQIHENTLFIAEGVLMYLSEADVKRLFDFIQRRAGLDSLFAFTFMGPRAEGPINFHNRSQLVDVWMRLRGEPFTWGIPKDSLASFLKSVGFSLEEMVTPSVLRQRYLSGALAQRPLAEGEYIGLAKQAT